jgi:hypothetical protein
VTRRLLGAADSTGDPASAARVNPGLVAMAPSFAAALAVSSLLVAQLWGRESARPLAFMVGFSASLLLVIRIMRSRGAYSGVAAGVLGDCALLAPIGLLPVVLAG